MLTTRSVSPLSNKSDPNPADYRSQVSSLHLSQFTQAGHIGNEDDTKTHPKSECAATYDDETFGQDDEHARSQGGSGEEDSHIFAGKTTWNTWITDFLCLGIPLGLLIFVIILISKMRVESSQKSIQKWESAASVLSTLFPILFAGVVSRLMLQAARWKLEGGASIGSLEQMVGSRTVGGAILTFLNLQAFNILTLATLLLWSLSPVGSQALTRLARSKESFITEPSSLQYFDTLATYPTDAVELYNQVPVMSIYASSKSMVDVKKSIYSALLLTPPTIQHSNMDLWNNIKIPFLNSSVNYQEQDGSNPYSSLLGIPVVNLAEGRNDFELESTYMELECDKLRVYSANNKSSIESPPNSTYLLQVIPFVPPNLPNDTFHGYDVNRGNTTGYASWSVSIDRFIDPTWFYRPFDMLNGMKVFENETQVEAGRTRLMFQAHFYEAVFQKNEDYLATYCDVSQKYISSNISCTKTSSSSRQNCTVVDQRPSKQYRHLPDSLSILNWQGVWSYISRSWPLAPQAQIIPYGEQDLTLQYLSDPNLNTINHGSTLGSELKDLDAKTLSSRLSQVLNTYVQLSIMNRDALNINTTYLEKNQTVKGVLERPATVFFISQVWAALAVISCFIMLAAGAASTYFAHQSVGPEVLGYATSAVRNNSLVDIPKETQNLGGYELAKRLRRRRVRYGVSNEDGVVTTGVGDEDRMTMIKERISNHRSRNEEAG